MAKTSYLGANISATDSFSGWIDKTNQVRDDMGNIVVTVTQIAGEPNTTNSGLTSGNLAISGVVTANTIAVSTALRGGTVTTPADLTITSNTLFNTTGNVDITGANTVNINSNNTIVTSNLTFNATSKFIKIDANTITVNTGAVTISSNATLAGSVVNVTSANITLGDASTDVLNVNAISDFNANVNIDGVLTATANATFSGATILFSGNTVTVNGNTTIGDSASVDRLTVTAALAADLIPTTNAVNLGSSANNYGNVFTTFVYAANNIQTSNQLVLNGAGTRTLKTLDPTTSAAPGTFNLVVANTTASVTALVANTTGIFASANVTYDLGSAAVSWKSLFVKDLTVVSNTVTANLTVSNLTSGRVSYTGTGGLAVDSANLTFSGTLLNVTGAGNITGTANVGGTLGVVGVATFSANVSSAGTANVNVLGVTTNANVGGTLGVTGVATFSANVSSSGTANVSTLGVTNNANVGGTLGVVGNATLSANLGIAANKYINIGTGPELQLYSNGTNSYISEGGSGTLNIDTTQLNIVTSNTTATETMATFVRGGASTLYHANTARVTTTSTGVNITGILGSGNTTITGDLTVTGSTTLASNVTLSVNTSTVITSTVTSLFTSSGNTIIGDATTDVVQFVAYANSSFIPAANNTYPLGSTTNYWSNLYSNNVTSLTVNGNTVNSNTVYANTAVVYSYHAEQSQTATLTTTTQAVIASFPIATFSAAELLICATQGSARHISKILLTHNGTTAYATEYGTILTGASLVTYDVDVSGGNVRFLATLASATSTVFNTALTLIKI
jgi:hypothetical protein